MNLRKFYSQGKKQFWSGVCLTTLILLGCSSGYGIYNSENNQNTHNGYYDTEMQTKISNQKKRGKHIPLIESDLANSKGNKQRKYVKNYIYNNNSKTKAENKLTHDFGYKVAHHDINLPSVKHTHPISNYYDHSLLKKALYLFCIVVLTVGGASVGDTIKFHFTATQARKHDFMAIINDVKNNLTICSSKLFYLNKKYMENKNNYKTNKQHLLDLSIVASTQQSSIVAICMNWNLLIEHYKLNKLSYYQKIYIKANLENIIKSIYKNTEYIRTRKSMLSTQKELNKNIIEAQNIMKTIKKM